MPNSWTQVQRHVYSRAAYGVKLSEFTGVYRRVAESLLRRGKLDSTNLPNGDVLLELPDDYRG